MWFDEAVWSKRTRQKPLLYDSEVGTHNNGNKISKNVSVQNVSVENPAFDKLHFVEYRRAEERNVPDPYQK